MALCNKPCLQCPMAVTVLIQGRCDCPELTDQTREIMREFEEDNDVAIIFRIGHHDIITQCHHSRNTHLSYESYLF